MASKRKSGPTQPESERANAQLLLRLPPRTIATIRAGAKRMQCTVSEYVRTMLGL